MSYIFSPEFKENFKTAYKNLYNLHPQKEEGDFRFRYLKVDWFFPNHIDNVLEQVKILGDKYIPEANQEISLFAALFHDAGLVYKRETSDPKNHEERSAEYAKEELSKMNYGPEFIDKVIEAISATEPEYKSDLPEAILVRNADAYSHMISMHFFAKSNFTESIHSFIDWFEKKVFSTISKISIPELLVEMDVIAVFYKKMIDNYRKNKDRDGFIENFLD